MYPQSMFCAKIRKKNQNISFKNYHFYSREILQYITWACLRNGKCHLCYTYTGDEFHYRLVCKELNNFRRQFIDASFIRRHF